MVNKNIINILGVILAFSLVTFLIAGKRDEFPGRRQGGGSRGTIPSQITAPEVCPTSGCKPQVQD